MDYADTVRLERDRYIKIAYALEPAPPTEPSAGADVVGLKWALAIAIAALEHIEVEGGQYSSTHATYALRQIARQKGGTDEQ